VSQVAGEGRAPLVDTHCHLTLLEREGLLRRAFDGAAAAGVENIVAVGLDLDDSLRCRDIAAAHPGVVFSAGWHPHQTASPDRAQLKALDELLDDPRAVAVGEIGIDLFFRPGYHEAPLDVQLRSFRAMLELAAAHAKPVLVHDRDAHEEVIDAVREARARGIMHCFSGDGAHAQRCVDAGFVISFAGIVTFPRAESLREAAAVCPEDAFVVETDSPFLAPVPHRGTTNLPERVADTAAAIASIRDLPVATVRAATTATARRILQIQAGHGVVGG